MRDLFICTFFKEFEDFNDIEDFNDNVTKPETKFSAKMQGCKRWLSDFIRVGRFWGGYSCFWVFFSVFG